MLIALVRKELRELLPIIVLTSLVQLLVIFSGTGVQLGFISSMLGRSTSGSMGAIPFISDNTTTYIFVVVGVCAIAVGLWQTMREANLGTFQYLLHRPIEREVVLGTKLVLGSIVCLVFSVGPLFYYALWAATPGTHASPFTWSMTASNWAMCACVPLVYLGSFLSGLWPGRWYASRFLPLLAGLIVAAMFSMVMYGVQSFIWLQLTLAVVIEIGYLIAIWYVARNRDYS